MAWRADRFRLSLYAVLALLASIVLQLPEAAPTLEFDRVVPLEITVDAPSHRIDYEAKFTGVVHVWTSAAQEVDFRLRIEDERGEPIAEDDDSGGGNTPYVGVSVEPGKKFVIVVALAKESTPPAAFRFHTIAALTTPSTQAAEERARAALTETRRLREARELTAARDLLERTAAALVEIPDASANEAVALTAHELGLEARAVGATEPALRLLGLACAHRLRTLPGDQQALLSVLLGYAAAVKEGSGDLKRALAIEEHVAAVRSRTLPEDDRTLLLARANLAVTRRDLGDLEGARELQEQVVDAMTRTRPADDYDLQATRLNLGATLLNLGQLARARSLLEGVLEVFERTLAQDHPGLLMTRQNLASAMAQLGDQHGARELQERVLETRMRTLPDHHPNLQLAREALAHTSRVLGDLERARALYEQAIEARSRTLPPDHPDLLAALAGLGSTFHSLGELHRARALNERVFEALSRQLPEDHPTLQRARQNLALVLRSLGDCPGARVLLEDALETAARTLPDEDPLMNMTRLNLASVLRDMGEFAAARTLCEQTLTAFERAMSEEHPYVQTARVNLATLALDLGELAVANEQLERALAVSERTMPATHRQVQVARMNLATTRSALGDVVRALELYEAVLAARVQSLPEDHDDLEVARRNVAFAIARVAATERQQGRDESTAVLRARFRPVALEHAAALRRSAAFAIGDGSSREAEARILAQSAALGASLSFAEGAGIFSTDAECVEAAFLASESMRGAALAWAEAARTARGDAECESLRARVQQASQELAAIARSESASGDEIDRARITLETAQRDLVRRSKSIGGDLSGFLEPDLATIAQRLGSSDALVAFRRYSRTTVGAGSRGDTTVEALCAFIARRADGGSTGSLARVEIGTVAAVTDAIDRWRGALGAGSGRGVSAGAIPSGVDERAAADAVRTLVWDPLRPQLSGVERWIVVLDDALHAVALEALPARDWSSGGGAAAAQDECLGDRVRIELRASALELLVDRAPPSGPNAFVALGGADFDADPSSVATNESAPPVVASARSAEDSGILRGSAWQLGFTPLPGALAEARSLHARFLEIAGTSSESTLLESKLASRERLFETAPRARFLHVATHGWSAPEPTRSESTESSSSTHRSLLKSTVDETRRDLSPMLQCGLALAGASRAAGATGIVPGLVTAEELATLDLSNCELAVLSACDTNVGVQRGGQGVASLQRALHMAGARSAITSLWKVPDEATKELMLDFYRRLWVEKKPKWQALWEAKKALREAKDEQGAPKYTTRDWAAWVLTGEPD